MEFLPLVALALLFWFFILRPQRRRTAQQAALWSGLEAGQEVVTVGGLHGRIKAVEDETVHLEVAPEVVVRVDRRGVVRRVEPASMAEDRG